MIMPHKPLQEQLVVIDGKITQDNQSKFFKQYGIIWLWQYMWL